MNKRTGTFSRGDRVRLLGDTFLRLRDVAALARERVPNKPLATVVDVGETRVVIRFDDSPSPYAVPMARLEAA